MNAVVHARCLNHPDREAAARCPSCGRFFCRECVTEHDARVICARCLAAQSGPRAARRRTALRLVLPVLAGLFLLWLGFYVAGDLLADIPAEVHDGTLWMEWMGE